MYGYRRIKKSLLEQIGWIINHKKILRIIKKDNLKVRYKDIFKTNWVKKHIEENVKPNLLKRNFEANKLNQKWVTDITYLIHDRKRAYLSSIMDLNSRDIISYKISYKMDNKLVISILNEKISKQKDVTGIILHFDQGFQYTSYEYKQIYKLNGIFIFMSKKSTPADNAPIESFHANLKR